MSEVNYPVDDCNHCGGQSEMTPENTRLELYVGFPLANHFYTTCTGCEETTRIFTENTAEEVEDYEYPVVELSMPSPELVRGVLRAYGIKPIKPKKLTPEQENLVDFFAYELQAEVNVMDFHP
jgi:hypothetical protein